MAHICTNRLLLAIAIILFLHGCSGNYFFLEDGNPESLEQTAMAAQTENGTMENPYEIGTFRAAYEKALESANEEAARTGRPLKGIKKSATSDIAPNYLYIRFDPGDDEQEDILKQYRDMVLIDYPFEYGDGEQYHRENPLGEGERLSHYTSIPIDMAYPKEVPHIILQRMYIPERDPKYSGQEDGATDDEISIMEGAIERAYTGTGNKELLPGLPLKKFLGVNLRGSWNPSGNIQIWDDNLGEATSSALECTTTHKYDYTPCTMGDTMNCPRRVEVRDCKNVSRTKRGSYVPIEGANVLIRDTWTLDRAIADSKGNFRHKSVRAKVRYIIKWDRFEFSIRANDGITQAEDKGPKLYKQPWNLRIDSGRMKYRGQIFQAAMHYYYHDIGGLTRPPTNGFWKKQMKITAKEKSEGNSFHAQQQRAGGAVAGGILGGPFGVLLGSSLTSTIRIAEYNHPSEQVYGATIHELAHAAHWCFDRGSYNKLVHDAWVGPFTSSSQTVKCLGPTASSARLALESWAVGVEVFLTRKRYRRLGDSDYEYIKGDERYGKNYQSQPIGKKCNNWLYYTSAIWDLVDDFDQGQEYGTDYPIDRASGFTMPELERAMKGTTSWDGLRDNVLKIGKQQNQVKELFANLQ